jgi:hypothetical protein
VTTYFALFREEASLSLRNMCEPRLRAHPHPALRATFSRKREKGSYCESDITRRGMEKLAQVVGT